MRFEPARNRVDRSMSLDREVIKYKIRTITEQIYGDELVKNMTMKICYQATTLILITFIGNKYMFRVI